MKIIKNLMVSAPRTARKSSSRKNVITSKSVKKPVTTPKSDESVSETEVSESSEGVSVPPVEETNTSSSSDKNSDKNSEKVSDKEETSSKSSNEGGKNESLENAFTSKLSLFTAKVASINKDVKELQSIGKTLEKDFNNVIKVISKQKNKSKNSENKTASGFAMPSLLSQEMYEFLGIKEGTRVLRQDVTKRLNAYIKDNNLRREDDKRYILPDATLMKILRCTEKDEVSYFTLQRFIKHHFIKDNMPKQQQQQEPIAVA